MREWRFCLIGGLPIDIALAALPFEESAVARSSLFEFESGCLLRTCSAENLIVMKPFAFRPGDVSDAESIVIRQRGVLDWRYIDENLQPLADIKEQPDIMSALTRLRQQA